MIRGFDLGSSVPRTCRFDSCLPHFSRSRVESTLFEIAVGRQCDSSPMDKVVVTTTFRIRRCRGQGHSFLSPAKALPAGSGSASRAKFLSGQVRDTRQPQQRRPLDCGVAANKLARFDVFFPDENGAGHESLHSKSGVATFTLTVPAPAPRQFRLVGLPPAQQPDLGIRPCCPAS